MPDWQSVEEAYASLKAVRVVFDDALALVIQGRNSGAVLGLEVLAREIQNLTQALLSLLAAPAPLSLLPGGDAARSGP